MDYRIFQHVITKGGEFYTMELKPMDIKLSVSDTVDGEFDMNAYLARVTNVPMPVLQVSDRECVSFDAILRIWFTEQELH